MRPTRDQASVASGGCEFRIMVNRIGIASSLGICNDQRGSECDLSGETISRISFHNLHPLYPLQSSVGRRSEAIHEPRCH